MIEIRQPDHELLRGLRFFAFGDNVINLRNLANRGGGAGAATGSPTAAARLGGYPAINGDGSDNLVTFDRFSNYFGSDSRDITVIGRFRSNSSHIGAPVAAFALGSNPGWNLLYSNFSGSETGFNFAVRSAAGKFMEAQDGVGDSGMVGKDVVFAGAYSHHQHECYAYLRNQGEPAATIRNAHTNTNSSNTATENWDVRAGSSPMCWLAFHDASVPFNGDVAWVAVFDRFLSNDEIARWSQDECWPFVEDYPLTTSFTARMYTTTILINYSAGFSQSGGFGSRTEINAIDASVFLSGDFVSSGGSTGTHTYVTSIGVIIAETVGQPFLRKYNTTVTTDVDVVPGFTQTFNTVVGAGQTKELLIDDRLDLMNTIGYRR